MFYDIYHFPFKFSSIKWRKWRRKKNFFHFFLSLFRYLAFSFIFVFLFSIFKTREKNETKENWFSNYFNSLIPSRPLRSFNLLFKYKSDGKRNEKTVLKEFRGWSNALKPFTERMNESTCREKEPKEKCEH